MIKVQNLTKRFGEKTVLEDISFTVDKGSIYGLVGFNGAGKTTLIKCIAGVYEADEGCALIDSRNTFTDAAVRAGMFYVPDDIWFMPYSTLEKMGRFYSAYYPGFSFDTMDKLCKVFGLDKKAKLNSFSKGMQRQAEMILAVSAQPKVLLLDESLDGLDPAKRNIMNNMILDYSAQKECSVIISSHNLSEISDICDRVALIDGKRIVFDCCVDSVGENRCKYRLVFTEDKTPVDFADFDVKKIKCDGKIVTLSLKGDREENEAKLRAMSPVLTETFPLTLEEVFLEEMEGSEHDFTEIFS